MSKGGFFSFKSKASATTLWFPFLAVVLTLLFFLIFMYPDSSFAEPILERTEMMMAGIIVAFADAILILLMFFFQPTKDEEKEEKIEKKKESKPVIVSSADDEEEEEEKTIVVSSPKKENDEVKEEEPKKPAFKVLEKKEPEPVKMPKVMNFPEKVGGGIYADTYISVGSGSTLKLRQEVVEEIYLIG